MTILFNMPIYYTNVRLRIYLLQKTFKTNLTLIMSVSLRSEGHGAIGRYSISVTSSKIFQY